MCRLCYLVAPLLIAAYLSALWSDWFTDAEFNAPVKRPVYSGVLDLRKVGPTVWHLTPERLSFARGKAHLSLSLNLNTLREIPGMREDIELRVKVVAEGHLPDGEWQDRLILDRNYRTDEPFSRAAGEVWASHGLGRVEYGLVAVDVVPGEEVRITLDVQVPDGRMMTGRPRLKLAAAPAGDAEYYPPIFRCILRQGGFLLSLALLGWLSVAAWRGRRHGGTGEKKEPYPWE